MSDASVRPLNEFADEVKGSLMPVSGTPYELYSVPAWDDGEPERVDGALIKSAKRPVQPDDVLISKINPRLNRTWMVGRATPGVVQIASPEWVTVRPKDGVVAEYLVRATQAPQFRRHLLDSVSGVTGSHARTKPAHVLAGPVACLEYSEQERRVLHLRRDFDALAVGQVGVQQVRRLLSATRRSKAHELVRRALDATQCLTEVQLLRDSKALQPAPAPSALPASVSSVLPDVSLGALCWDINYGTSTKCSYDGSGTAVLRIPNIVGGGIRLNDLKRAEAAGVVPANLLLKSGDLLIVRSNGSPELIGRCAPVLANLDAAFASYLIRLRLLSQVVRPEWVALVLGSPAWRELLQARAASSAGQHNLSIGKLASLPMPLPPLHVQDALLAEAASVGARIAQMDATCEALARKIAATTTSLLQQRLAPTEESS